MHWTKFLKTTIKRNSFKFRKESYRIRKPNHKAYNQVHLFIRCWLIPHKSSIQFIILQKKKSIPLNNLNLENANIDIYSGGALRNT